MKFLYFIAIWFLVSFIVGGFFGWLLSLTKREPRNLRNPTNAAAESDQEG